MLSSLILMLATQTNSGALPAEANDNKQLTAQQISQAIITDTSSAKPNHNANLLADNSNKFKSPKIAIKRVKRIKF